MDDIVRIGAVLCRQVRAHGANAFLGKSLALLILALAAACIGQSALAQDAPSHLVVFNKPGANWDRREEFREEAREHYMLYTALAERGDIIVGGRMDATTGEPPIGLSVFRSGDDSSRIQKALEQDPLVKAGVISLEFRAWSIQMGALHQPEVKQLDNGSSLEF